MRDLAPTLPALALPAGAAARRPGSLSADVPGLASDVERRFLALEAYCAELRTVPPRDPEFRRLDGLVTEAVQALAEAPARDLAGLVAKARALIECPAIDDEDVRRDLVGGSLGRDVLRLLAAAHPAPGGHRHES